MIPEALQTFSAAAAELEADIMLLNSGMFPPADEAVRVAVAKRKSARAKVILILVTSGGLPDVAYRIAMHLRDRYDHITVCIPGWCKSAGTLLAIAGNDLIMGRKGEMGPLDVQIAKRDDIAGDRDSGLVINEALARLRDESFELFSDFMLKLIAQSSNLVTLRTAADIAAQLTIGLMAPIFEKIDPMRMGADARAMSIGQDYALRLNRKGQNLKGSDALNMLLNGYPSHSFVIDINEARELFTRVQPLDGKLGEAVEQLGKVALSPRSDSPAVLYLEGDDDGEADEREDPSGEPPDAIDDTVDGGLDDAGAPEDVQRDHEDRAGQTG